MFGFGVFLWVTSHAMKPHDYYSSSPPVYMWFFGYAFFLSFIFCSKIQEMQAALVNLK